MRIYYNLYVDEYAIKQWNVWSIFDTQNVYKNQKSRVKGKSLMG